MTASSVPAPSASASSSAAPDRLSTAFVVSFAVFAVLVALSVFGGLASDSAAFFRAHATAWSMIALATPAMTLYVVRYRRHPLDGWWRWLWSLGWAMNLLHVYYGLFQLHDGQPLTVFQRQGFVLAFSIFFFTALWGIDVIVAWVRPGWQLRYDWLNGLALVVGFATFFISTVIFQNDRTSLAVGLIMTLCVAGGLVSRLLSPSPR